ncbi:hypothetical protein B0J17DRAFT_646626 [Rhizoctonia solani]|nr:hypothetical protein B0J17DRAFT_646626 [Rhizoctonia solani]
MILRSSLCVLLLNLAVSCYAQSDGSPSNPPKKTNGVTIAIIIVFMGVIGLLIFYYSMNIIRKRRKRKDAAALPQYVDLNPLQGVQNPVPFNPFHSNPVIIVTPPRSSADHQHPQDDQVPPPYELPKPPPPVHSRNPL